MQPNPPGAALLQDTCLPCHAIQILMLIQLTDFIIQDGSVPLSSKYTLGKQQCEWKHVI